MGTMVGLKMQLYAESSWSPCRIWRESYVLCSITAHLSFYPCMFANTPGRCSTSVSRRRAIHFQAQYRFTPDSAAPHQRLYQQSSPPSPPSRPTILKLYGFNARSDSCVTGCQ